MMMTMMLLNNISKSNGKSLLINTSCKCRGYINSLLTNQRRGKSDVNDPEKPMKESTVPSDAWSHEAVALYDRLVEDTSNKEWVKIHRQTVKGKIRPFLRATGDNMFMGAVFVNQKTMHAKGVITFGPWCEGGPGHVHGGAVATVHDSITGVLANVAVGTCVTANLNTNFRFPLRLYTTTLVTAKVESVVGRKIMLTSRVTSPDGKLVYGDATALFLLLNV